MKPILSIYKSIRAYTDKNLNSREKIFVSVALAAILTLALYYLAVLPIMENRALLRQKIRVKTDTLAKMQDLQSQYNAIVHVHEGAKVRFANREKGFALFSFLDKLAGKAGVKKNIAYMKPSTKTLKDRPFKISSVEMKLQNLSLREVAIYLHTIETSQNNLVIKKLAITKTGKQKGLINAVFQVETLLPA
jgi:general secretion pathway protein M